jgi:hypothetical protein
MLGGNARLDSDGPNSTGCRALIQPTAVGTRRCAGWSLTQARALGDDIASRTTAMVYGSGGWCWLAGEWAFMFLSSVALSLSLCRCPVECPPNCSVKMSAHQVVRVS